jgi:hypothetical protein
MPICYALLSIAVASVLIGVTKPSAFMDARGQPKNFGVSEDDTVMPAWLAMAGVGYIVYLVTSTLEQ